MGFLCEISSSAEKKVAIVKIKKIGAVEMKRGRVLAFANQKGGVGKTTTTVNLASAVAQLGYKVLVVDSDPQGNASSGLGVNTAEMEHHLYHCYMNEAAVGEAIRPVGETGNLFVLPTQIDLIWG